MVCKLLADIFPEGSATVTVAFWVACFARRSDLIRYGTGVPADCSTAMIPYKSPVKVLEIRPDGGPEYHAASPGCPLLRRRGITFDTSRSRGIIFGTSAGWLLCAEP